MAHLYRAVLAAVFGISCFISVAAAQTPPEKGPEVWAYLAKLPADQRIKVIEAQADKEGQLVLWGVLGIDRAEKMLQLFRERYPGIKTQFVRLTADSATDRLLLEQRAGNVTADAIISSTTYLDLQKSALAPYEPSTWKDFDPRFLSGSRDEGWTAMSYEVLPEAYAWRTDRVSSAEAPKTLDDVANPKWHGRAGTTDQLERVINWLEDKYGKNVAMTKVKALAALDNQLYKSIAALSQGLAAGQIDLAWGIGVYRADQLKREGAPVNYVFADPLSALGVTISVVKNSPSPYAAALFMDFLTRADTLQKLDKIEPGRMFGNTKGSYAIKLADYPSLTLYKPISTDRFKELNKIVQDLFIRR